MSTLPPLVIDMHTHVFNAKYVPLEEIAISRKVPARIAKPLARVLLILTRSSRLRYQAQERFGIDPQAQLMGVDDKHPLNHEEHTGELLIADVLSQLALDASAADSEFEARVLVAESEMFNELQQLNREFGDTESSSELENLMANADTLREKKALVELYDIKGLVLRGLKRMLRRFIKKALNFVESTGDTLDFFYSMTASEKTLFDRLSKYYADKEVPYLFVHYMMDMAAPFEGEVEHEFYASQIPRMAGLAQYSQGRLLGFAAFDPIRFVNNESDREDIIRHLDYALENGKLGFKFYPPLGFKAAGNENTNLETVIDVFLDYCAERQVPVFTHCTPSGFEVVPDTTGFNAHPKYWRQALEKEGHENRRDLRLCFGHAGGGKRTVHTDDTSKVVMGWLSNDAQWEDPDNYAAHVVNLCKEFKNVYCEIGYLHEIMDDASYAEAFKARLKAEFERADDGAYDFGKKIMYGSDWHMPSMINDVDDFLEQMMEYFEDDATLSPHRSTFFAGNAIDYLQLEGIVEHLGEVLGVSYREGLTSALSAYRT